MKFSIIFSPREWIRRWNELQLPSVVSVHEQLRSFLRSLRSLHTSQRRNDCDCNRISDFLNRSLHRRCHFIFETESFLELRSSRQNLIFFVNSLRHNKSLTCDRFTFSLSLVVLWNHLFDVNKQSWTIFRLPTPRNFRACVYGKQVLVNSIFFSKTSPLGLSISRQFRSFFR